MIKTIWTKLKSNYLLAAAAGITAIWLGAQAVSLSFAFLLNHSMISVALLGLAGVVWRE